MSEYVLAAASPGTQLRFEPLENKSKVPRNRIILISVSPGAAKKIQQIKFAAASPCDQIWCPGG